MPFKQKEIEKKYFSTKDVASLLSVPRSTITYYRNLYGIQMNKASHGRRGYKYTQREVEFIRSIIYLRGLGISHSAILRGSGEFAKNAITKLKTQ